MNEFASPRVFAVALGVSALSGLIAFQAPTHTGLLTDPFAAGWMAMDTNGDGLADFIAGKIVVSAHPSAAESSDPSRAPQCVNWYILFQCRPDVDGTWCAATF